MTFSKNIRLNSVANSETGKEFDSLKSEDDDSPKDKLITELQDDLEAEKDGRKSDRFLYMLVAVIVLDIHVFASMQSWSGPLSILALELLFLVVIADRFDISVVERFLDKALSSVIRKQ